MKGNQGLEALANLCGGATKACSIDEVNTATNAAPGDSSNQNQAVIAQAAPPAATAVTAAPTAVATPQTTNILGIPAGLPGFSQQQLQQCLMTAAYGGATVPPANANAAAVAAIMSAAYQQTGATGNPPLQQLAYTLQGQYQAIYQAQAAQMAQQFAQQQQRQFVANSTGESVSNTNPASAFVDATAVAAAAAKAALSPPQQGATPVRMQPPAPRQQQQTHLAPLAPQPTPVLKPCDETNSPTLTEMGSSSSISPSVAPSSSASQNQVKEAIATTEATAAAASNAAVTAKDKKELKRAANRRSAQLSRKRKKHFIEELKEENDDLRRKEQILRSIPDLIVVFDSAGRLEFVSHSVSNFLDYSPSDLEGTSFWHRLCDESVRLLKAAFMDALAAREEGVDTSPLGDGLWELRLKDKNESHKLVTLNGVVHFSGEVPECVCSIRPKEKESSLPKKSYQAGEQRVIFSPSTKLPAEEHRARVLIKPQQSVVSSITDDASSVQVLKKQKIEDASSRRNLRLAAQISDGESMSEAGSDET